VTRFVLLRHGQTEWNRDERLRGRADVPLNSVGRAQAQACARRVDAEFTPAAVYSSPLSRAVHTAEAIADKRRLTVGLHSGFVDLDYGDWQGLSPGDVRSRWPTLADAWYRTPEQVQIPGGEMLALLQSRSLGALAELAARHGGETVVVVAHDAVNRALLTGFLGAEPRAFHRIRQDTGCINVVEASGASYAVVSVNDTCQLGR
jgi:probable phosphoglycerate mutase